ncbi:ABC transporter permease [Blastochloris sulfoviridis]|uniref:ABC transporter permease n=1 Tax=Blastochloris sulfoviridis TaxID=50712 RepID=A0A5M6I391_9HYPH|nr:ABC transporter permease [Blastochloris sulfoviridis]KAA5602671.1 ABC transporter permease [Blastochloris sulfoviridis]
MGLRIINRRPGRGGALFWGALPFLAVLALYLTFSAMRLAENPNDKLLPALSTIAETVVRLAFTPDQRTGQVLLWVDTAASLARLAWGLAVSAALGLVIGIASGLVPYLRAGLSPFVAVVSLIPPMALLPILFISFGLDELSKVVLIVIGIAPFLIRDLAMRVEAIPPELVIKAQTLGASTWQIITRLVLPTMLPKLIDALRLSLGPAWLFLISAEAIAAQDGLGYRIFLVRRYLAMDVILPYVAWITLMAFLMDWGLRALNRRTSPWLTRGMA